MKRGSLYWVNFDPSKAPEFGKIRPGLVISNSEQNLCLSTLVVIPISSQSPEIWPLRLQIDISKEKSSFLVIPGIRQISKARLEEQIGQLPSSVMAQVDKALQAYLSDI